MNKSKTHTLAQFFKSKNIKCYFDSSTRTICLFDDDYYSNIDYDFVSNKFRSLIRIVLKSEGFLEKSSRTFIGDFKEEYTEILEFKKNQNITNNKITISFAKPPHTLGADPSSNIFEELNKNSLVFSTPTQTLLIMAKNGSWSQDTAKNLIKQCPANIDKIYQWLRELGIKTPTKKQLSELKALQEKSFKKKVLRQI